MKDKVLYARRMSAESNIGRLASHWRENKRMLRLDGVVYRDGTISVMNRPNSHSGSMKPEVIALPAPSTVAVYRSIPQEAAAD